ncbi:phage protein Gp36 family protein [Tannerella forsythia]|uniref:phage protein Gp36 family protein n=1 Tax=Tannerella forsythia TaxID=28112 RepID=UPI0028DCB1BA|nr:phage protein Gp36 family protein [Tannerella forsythia]
MFLDSLDYKVTIGERAFDLIQQSEEANRLKAEEMAMEEMAGYLRPKYNIPKIFARRGEERNMHLVMTLCDMALYHLVSWLPSKMGYEIREIRYKRAIEWLEGVQKGKIVPDLDLAVDEDGETGASEIRYGGEKRNNYMW